MKVLKEVSLLKCQNLEIGPWHAYGGQSSWGKAVKIGIKGSCYEDH